MNTDNLTSALNLLAEKLGVAVSEVYSVLIAQARVAAIKTPIWVIGYGLIIFAAVLLMKKCFFERKYEGFSMEEKVSLMQYLEWTGGAGALVALVLMNIIMCFAAVLLSIKILNVLSNCITALMNPQFWALDYILGIIS